MSHTAVLNQEKWLLSAILRAANDCRADHSSSEMLPPLPVQHRASVFRVHHDDVILKMSLNADRPSLRRY